MNGAVNNTWARALAAAGAIVGIMAGCSSVEPAATRENRTMQLYIATDGNDRWSGELAAPNRTNTDGPLASLAGARNRLRYLRGVGPTNVPAPASVISDPVTVWIRGGRYELKEPVVFDPGDSYPVTFTAYRREKPVFDGGRRITGWTVATHHGRKAWTVELPEVSAGAWSFRELYVNGRRAVRPRWPAAGMFRMAAVPGLKLPCGWGGGGQTRFVAAKDQVRRFHNLADVEAVYLHFWIEERSPLADVNIDSREVTLTRPSRSAMVGSFGSQLADYYYDNVFEELREPGQWYLDRPAGKLIYLPRPGETPANTEVVAPRCLQLLAVLGRPDENRTVDFLRFRGLTFRHTDWRHPSHDGAAVLGSGHTEAGGASKAKRYSRGNQAGASQSACDVPGIITFEGARHCALEDCTVELGGWYAVEIGDGCRNLRIVGNILRELGAGGVRITGASADDRCPARETGQCRVTDNEIRAAGRVFHSAAGVLSMHANGMVIAHNHIHDLFYTGISCGWEWGYQANISRDNRIEKNHIHDIGQGLLSDMGGIYTLGVQPGTVLRGNLIHDVRSVHYGGWCIYPDEGSSHLLIEDNVCYDADRQPFHQHYGRENVVRNNIFAFGGESLAHYSRSDDHIGFTFTKNLLVTDGKPIYTSGYRHKLADRKFISDLNLLFDVSGKPLAFKDQDGRILSLSQWRDLGQDLHSKVADPLFRDWKKRDFRLRRGSPALALGFVPPDLSDVGPRPASKRD